MSSWKKKFYNCTPSWNKTFFSPKMDQTMWANYTLEWIKKIKKSFFHWKEPRFETSDEINVVLPISSPNVDFKHSPAPGVFVARRELHGVPLRLRSMACSSSGWELGTSGTHNTGTLGGRHGMLDERLVVDRNSDGRMSGGIVSNDSTRTSIIVAHRLGTKQRGNYRNNVPVALRDVRSWLVLLKSAVVKYPLYGSPCKSYSILN